MHAGFESRLLDFVQTVTTNTDINVDTDLVMNNYLDSLLLMDLVIFVEKCKITVSVPCLQQVARKKYFKRHQNLD